MLNEPFVVKSGCGPRLPTTPATRGGGVDYSYPFKVLHWLPMTTATPFITLAIQSFFYLFYLILVKNKPFINMFVNDLSSGYSAWLYYLLYFFK